MAEKPTSVDGTKLPPQVLFRVANTGHFGLKQRGWVPDPKLDPFITLVCRDPIDYQGGRPLVRTQFKILATRPPNPRELRRLEDANYVIVEVRRATTTRFPIPHVPVEVIYWWSMGRSRRSARP